MTYHPIGLFSFPKILNTTQKTEDELGWNERISSSCFTSETRRITREKSPIGWKVMNEERKKSYWVKSHERGKRINNFAANASIKVIKQTHCTVQELNLMRGSVVHALAKWVKPVVLLAKKVLLGEKSWTRKEKSPIGWKVMNEERKKFYWVKSHERGKKKVLLGDKSWTLVHDLSPNRTFFFPRSWLIT
jgi:hypothetical protein